MTVAITASQVQCLGVVSSGAPASIAFNPAAGATFLLVVAGWQSAATFVAPSVSWNGEMMELSTVKAYEAAHGVVCFWSLSLSSAAAGNVIIQPSTFLGNTQIAIYAVSGTSQQLGVKLGVEFGTNDGSVNTGTMVLNGVTPGSLTAAVGMTFFGGTPPSITASAGWTSTGQAIATNEGVYAFHSSGSGDLSITLQDPAGSYFTMLVVGVEILAGTVPGAGSGVRMVTSAAASLGVISSAVPGTFAFTAAPLTDLIVAVVGWASSSPLTPPAVTYNSELMQIVTSPMMVDAGNGAVALYVLVPTAPDGAAHNFVVNSAPNFAGHTGVHVAAYIGSNGRIGAVFPSQFGAHDSGTLSGTAALNGIAVGSSLAFVGMSFFGSKPNALLRSSGWDDAGASHVSDALQSVWGFHNRSVAGGNFTITLSNSDVFFNLLCLGYEVQVAGTPAAQADVVITASKVARLGAFGLDTVSTTFDVAGGSYLIVCAQRSNSLAAEDGRTSGATTFGGVPVPYHAHFHLLDTNISGVMDVGILPSPLQGPQVLSIAGFTGNAGYNNVILVAVSVASGVVGVRVITSAQGNALSLGLSASVAGSLMLAFIAQPHTFNTLTPNYGWQSLQHDVEPSQLASWLFSGIGSATTDLLLTATGFSSVMAIVMEVQRSRVATPAVNGTGAVMEQKGAVAAVGTHVPQLVPNHQDFHIYWESWLDIPQKSPDMTGPDDFYLARVPPYVKMVCLSFAIPLCTYAGLDSAIEATTGLGFPGNGHQLKAVLDLLRSRNPGIQVVNAIQPHFPDHQSRPYDPASWAGVTSAHLAAHARFIADMGMAGVVLDYEVVADPALEDLSYHCQTINGLRVCYTDNELLWVIKTFRAGLPRPLIIILDMIHVGAYGEGNYITTAPGLGWNTGYNLCITRDQAALDAIDVIHLMTYDAGEGYDPRRAARAFMERFPGKPMYFGLRVGPADFAGIKTSAANMVDFANMTIKLGPGMAGCHMYSMMWDVSTGTASTEGAAPFGNYGPDFPDSNIGSAAVARVYGLSLKDRLTAIARGKALLLALT